MTRKGSRDPSGANLASVKTASAKPANPKPVKAPAMLSNIDHFTAQAELDARLFPHYLLGRQLALEEVVRELLQAAPKDVRSKVLDTLHFQADQGMDRLRDGIADPQQAATDAGYVCTLLVIGA